MAETQNSPTDTEKSDGGQCTAHSAVQNSKDMRFPNSPGGVVKRQQGDGVENQEQGCFCPKTKRKMIALKCSTQNTRKKLRRRSGNEENDVSGIHTDRPLLSQESAQDVGSLEQPSIAVTRGEGDAITHTGQLYATEPLPRISETRVGAPSTDILEAPSYNSLVHDCSNPPRTDRDRRFPGFLASESQNSPYNAMPRNRMKSLLATFSNSQIPLGPAGGYFCAQNIDDMKLFQVLRYIEFRDGGLDLLWNFIHEQAELQPLQYVNVTQDTVDQENHEGEENHNLDAELSRVYGFHPAESQEEQLPRYGDVRHEVDYQGPAGVKPHTENCFGEKNVGVLAEDRENCFVGISDNEHERQSAGVKEEISDIHGIESESTVDRSDVEDNQDKEVEFMMGESNVESEIKEENSDIHDIESESTVDHSDIEDNQDKEVEIMMGESNVKSEIEEENSDIHDIESESTVDRSDVEDNQDKEVEIMMGESNVEGEIKEEILDLRDFELHFTAEHSDVEDNPYKETGDSLNDSNLEAAELKGKTDPFDIESELSLAHNNTEAIDASSSCDNSDNMSGNRSEQEYPRKSDYFSSGGLPEFISIFAASNISISENKEVDGECPLFCEGTTTKPTAVSADCSVSCKECSTHCNGVGSCTNGYICGDGQYHHRKEDFLTEDGRGKPMCCVVGHSEDKRKGLTGSNVEAEKMPELYAETEGSQVENGDNNPVGQTSSDIVAGCPVSPKADLNDDGEIYLVPGHVQGDVISHLKDHENIFDTARLNIKENETHCGGREGEQREETGKQGCPVWQILEHLECPFNWVPDICIMRTPGGTIQENMIDHLTGKPTVMIQFVK